jgi:hypothetical protein
MEKRNVTVTLEKAKEWYNSNNESLKEIALQAFSRDEIMLDFENITSFKEACIALGLNCIDISIIIGNIARFSRASADMLKLNIIRKALNLGQGLHFAKNPENSYIYHPYNPLITEDSDYYKSELFSGQMEVIGKVRIEGTLYKVLGGDSFIGTTGLGCFNSFYGTCSADTGIGFLGCASKKIAQHFGKYFGMLITEAKYGDMVDFEII